MSLSNHWDDCWRLESHPACRLAYIHDLKVKVLALETQLQYERTGHLTPQEATHQAHIPCGSIGPTWAHPCDDPPSLTP